jgi:type VI secretion system secreted protein VgrG
MAYLTEVDIKINGESFTNFQSLTVSQSLYKNGQFTLNCRFDAIEDANTFLIEKSQEFLGARILIQTSVKEISEDSVKNALQFKGIITGISGTKTGQADGNRIVISGSSPEIVLDRKPTSRAFLDKTLKDIVNEVLKPYDVMLLSPMVEPRSQQTFSYVVQYEESDLEFLRRLSVRYGEWFYYSGDKLVFGELQNDTIDMIIGIDTNELNYSLNIRPLKFSLYTWELMNHKGYSIKNEVQDTDSELTSYGKHARKVSWDVFHEEGVDYFEHLNNEESNVKEALKRAVELQAKADAIRLSTINGKSSNPFVRIGYAGNFKALKESEQGMVDYGKVIFTETIHYIDNLLNYRNAFQATPGTSGIPENCSPYNIRRAFPQLAVVKDNRDPEKTGRIRVRFSWMPTDQMSQWISVNTPYVHESSGVFFVPAENSAVLINFEGGDIERPHCNGAFFTKIANPDESWTGNRNESEAKTHAIRTYSGNTIEFHDSDGGEKIRIYDAKGKNEIVLDSANGILKIRGNGDIQIQAGGKLKMSASEIEINADSNIKIKAGATLDQSATDIKSGATAGQEISGVNIGIKADASLKAEGTATAEVSSSGIAVIKGSLVKIN